jgi:hypothetical protein
MCLRQRAFFSTRLALLAWNFQGRKRKYKKSKLPYRMFPEEEGAVTVS